MPYYDVNGLPTDTPPAWLAQQTSLPNAPQAPQSNFLLAGLSSGFHGVLGDVGSTAQALGRATGWDRLSDAGKAFADQQQAAATASGRPDLEANPWSIKGIGYQVAKAIPSIGGMAAAGLLAPEAAAPAWLARAGAALPRLLGGGAGLAEDAAAAAGKAFAGRMVGATAAGLPLSIGQNVQAAEQGSNGAPLSQGQALGAIGLGVPEAAIGGFGPATFGQGAEGTLARRILTGAAVGAPVQAAQQAVQTGLTQFMGDPNRPIADRAREVVDSALQGGLVGGVFGGAFGALHKMTAGQIGTGDLKAGLDQALGLPPPDQRGSTYRGPRPDDPPEESLPEGPLEALPAPPPGPNPFRDRSTEELQAAHQALNAPGIQRTPGQDDILDAATTELQRRTMPGLPVGQGTLFSADEAAARDPLVQDFKTQVFGGMHSADPFVQNFNATNEPELINALGAELTKKSPSWLKDLGKQYGVVPGVKGDPVLDEAVEASDQLQKAEDVRASLSPTQNANVLRMANAAVIDARARNDAAQRLVDLHNQAHDLITPPKIEADATGQLNLPGMGIAKRLPVQTETLPEPTADQNQPSLISSSEAGSRYAPNGPVDKFQQGLVAKYGVRGDSAARIGQLDATNETELVRELRNLRAQFDSNPDPKLVGQVPGGKTGVLQKMFDDYHVGDDLGVQDQKDLESTHSQLTSEYDALHDQASAAKARGNTDVVSDILQKQLPAKKAQIAAVEHLQDLHAGADELPFGAFDVPGRVAPRDASRWEMLERAKQLQNPAIAPIADQAQRALETNAKGKAGIVTLATNRISALLRNKTNEQYEPPLRPNITEASEPPTETGTSANAPPTSSVAPGDTEAQKTVRTRQRKPKNAVQELAPASVDVREPARPSKGVRSGDTQGQEIASQSETKQEVVKAQQRKASSSIKPPDPERLLTQFDAEGPREEAPTRVRVPRKSTGNPKGEVAAVAQRPRMSREGALATLNKIARSLPEGDPIRVAAENYLAKDKAGDFLVAQGMAPVLHDALRERQSNIDLARKKLGAEDRQSAAQKIRSIPAWAQEHADDLHGEVIHADKNFALVRTQDQDGNYAYFPVNRSRGVRTTFDITKANNDWLTPATRSRLTTIASLDRSREMAARRQGKVREEPGTGRAMVPAREEPTSENPGASEPLVAAQEEPIPENSGMGRALVPVKEELGSEDRQSTTKLTPKDMQLRAMSADGNTDVGSIPVWAQEHADDLHGKVIYSDNDFALVRAHDPDGDYVYFPVNRSRGVRTETDITQATNDWLTPAVKSRLTTVANLDQAKEMAAYRKNPDGPFKGATENVVGTRNVPDSVLQEFKDLAKVTGLSRVRIFVVGRGDTEGANADAHGLVGPYSPGRLGERIGLGDNMGAVAPMGPGKKDFVVYIGHDRQNAQLNLEIVAHEFGHILLRTTLKSVPKRTLDAIVREHQKFLNSTEGKTAGEIVSATRNREMYNSEAADEDVSRKLTDEEDAYYRSFSEWFADQVSRSWTSAMDNAMSSQKDRSMLAQFFHNIAQSIKKIIAYITGNREEDTFAPNKVVKNMLAGLGPASDREFLQDLLPPPNSIDLAKGPASLKAATPKEAEQAAKGVMGVAQSVTTQLGRKLFDDAKGMGGAVRRGALFAMTGQGLSDNGSRYVPAIRDYFDATEQKGSIKEGINKSFARAMEPFYRAPDALKGQIMDYMIGLQRADAMTDASEKARAMAAIQPKLDTIRRAQGLPIMQSMLRAAQTMAYQETTAYLHQRISDFERTGQSLGLNGLNIGKQFSQRPDMHDNPELTNEAFRDAASKLYKMVADHVEAAEQTSKKFKWTPGARSREILKVTRGLTKQSEKVAAIKAANARMDEEQAKYNAAMAPLGALKFAMRYADGRLKQAKSGTYMPLGRGTGKFFVNVQLAKDNLGVVKPEAVAALERMLQDRGFDHLGTFGDHQDNSSVYMRVEKEGQMERLRQAMEDLKEAGHLDPGEAVLAGYPERLATSPNLRHGMLQQAAENMREILKDLPEDIGAEAKQQIEQGSMLQWLDMLPEHALIRSLQPRTFVGGFDKDMAASLALRGQASANATSSMFMSGDMAAVKSAMRQQVQEAKEGPNGVVAQDFAREIMIREAQQEWQVPVSVFDHLQRIAHSIVIGANPAYVLTALSQVPILGHPELAKTHGYAKSALLISRSTKRAFNALKAVYNSPDAMRVGFREDALRKAGIPEKDIKTIMRLDNQGSLSNGVQTSSLIHMGEGENPLEAKRHEWMNALGTYSEMLPRVIIGLAAGDAYDERPVKGMTRDEFVKATVDNSQYKWGAGMSSRMTGKRGLFGPASKIMLGFMQFQTHMLEKLYHETHNLIAGDSPEARRQAGVFLASHLAAVTAIAGTLGLPAAGLLTGGVTKLGVALSGNSDFDAEAYYRDWLSNVFGKQVGEAIAKGPVRSLTGIDFSHLGDENLIPFTKMVGERRKFEDAQKDWYKSMAGSAMGELGNLYLGGRDMVNGDYLLGATKMLPEGLKGIAEAAYAAQHGYTDKFGDKGALQPTGTDIGKLALGLDPASKAQFDEANRIRGGIMADRQYQSQNISRHLLLATNTQNPSDEQYWLGQAAQFQQQHPGLGSPLTDFSRSLQTHLMQGAYARATGLPPGIKPLDFGVQNTLGFARPQ